MESDWSHMLADGDLSLRIKAAGILWQKHSGLFSREILKFLDVEASHSDEMQNLRREIEESFLSANILRELHEGDYAWEAWLAFLRPDAQFVPTLLEHLDSKAEHRPATLMALGKTRDRKAFEPLRRFLQSDEYIASGFAAEALGILGFADGEPLLIEALSSDNTWLQVNACQGLALIGTRRAMAQRAIESINVRGE